VCALQAKVRDALVWLTLQEKRFQKMLKDSASETYCNKYHVSNALGTRLHCFGEEWQSVHLEKYYLRVSIAVKRHHDHSNSYKGKHLIWAGLRFWGLVRCCHGRKHGDVQTGMSDAGEVAESSTSRCRKKDWDTLPPTRPHLLIVSCPILGGWGAVSFSFLPSPAHFRN
jgi:hypothetical protein